MNLLSLLLLSAFVLAIGATVPAKVSETNNVPDKEATDNQPQENSEDEPDKKVGKRSYGWNPWGGYSGYGYGWPWYGYGHGWYGGWYPGWPFYGHGGGYGGGYGGYGYGYGYHGGSGHGGWYKGW